MSEPRGWHQKTMSYLPLCKLGLAHHVIGFEPLEERLTERASVENGTSLTLLPYAVGDGRPHTFYINNEDATSSLYPLNEAFCSAFEGLRTLKTVRETKIETVRLDDALVQYSIPIDFLKLDIQGSELTALAGAEAALERTAVVHCEVEFAPIYEGQPLYPEIQAFLNAKGFALIDILVSHRYAHESPSHIRTQIASSGLMQSFSARISRDASFCRKRSRPSLSIKNSPWRNICSIGHLRFRTIIEAHE